MGDALRARREMFAAVSALTVLAWYALPDVVRSRRARGAVKAALLGVTAAGAAAVPEVFPEARSLANEPRVDLPVPALAVLAVTAAAVLAAGTVWFERACFALGERRRARGVRCAHTSLAAALAVATGAAALLDRSALAGRGAR